MWNFHSEQKNCPFFTLLIIFMTYTLSQQLLDNIYISQMKVPNEISSYFEEYFREFTKFNGDKFLSDLKMTEWNSDDCAFPTNNCPSLVTLHAAISFHLFSLAVSFLEFNTLDDIWWWESRKSMYVMTIRVYVLIALWDYRNSVHIS